MSSFLVSGEVASGQWPVASQCESGQLLRPKSKLTVHDSAVGRIANPPYGSLFLPMSAENYARSFPFSWPLATGHWPLATGPAFPSCQVLATYSMQQHALIPFKKWDISMSPFYLERNIPW